MRMRQELEQKAGGGEDEGADRLGEEDQTRRRKHASGVPKKTFQCPIKSSSKVVCLVVPYPNIFWTNETFYGTLKLFWDTQYYT